MKTIESNLFIILSKEKLLKFTFCVSLGLFSTTNQHFAQTNTNLGASSGTGGTGTHNSFSGFRSGQFNTTGYTNSFMGSRTGSANTTGIRNSYLGYSAGLSNISGHNNVAIGGFSGQNNQVGSHNLFLGTFSGRNNLGSGNLFIGYKSGYNETGSNKLYIDNSNTSSPLIYGDFQANTLKINGDMEVTGNLKCSNISNSGLNFDGAGGVNFGIREEPLQSCLESKWHFDIGRDCGVGPIPPISPLMTFHYTSGSITATKVGIGVASPKYGKLMIQDVGVPLAFKVSGANERTGGLWRMYVVNGGVGFDVNTGTTGNEFGSANYKRPLKMENSGNYGRVAIANNFLAAQYELDVNGKVRATQYLTYSDKRLKKDIKSIKNAGELLSQLEGVTYNYRQDLKEEGRNLPEGKKIGFIAQDLQKVIPEIVAEDEQGYLSVDYQGLIPILVENQKELNTQNEELKEKLIATQETNRKLELEIENIKTMLSNLSGNIPTQTIHLENTAENILFQNAPNPFSESTSIEYNLPIHCVETQLIILNSNGKLIQSISNLNVGYGKVVLEANSLTPGTYHYKLVCQGQNLASKSMVIIR